MTNEQIEKMLLQVINELDYDLYKFFDPELSEDPEESEELMERLVEIVKKHID